MIEKLNNINIETPEGKLLIAAISRLVVLGHKKTPDEALEDLNILAKQIEESNKIK